MLLSHYAWHSCVLSRSLLLNNPRKQLTSEDQRGSPAGQMELVENSQQLSCSFVASLPFTSSLFIAASVFSFLSSLSHLSLFLALCPSLSCYRCLSLDLPLQLPLSVNDSSVSPSAHASTHAYICTNARQTSKAASL